jgi:two-component system, OmpR family, alkaline phosphatase synthesis response regulator PhoP
MKENFRILVVEDEEDLNEILRFNLESEGYTVDAAFSAEEALRKDLSLYDLFLLDVMMGKISGFNLAQRMRKDVGIQAPVIFLTARSTETDLLTGFNLGADDYITKPFSIREMQARVKAVLKRSKVIVPKADKGSISIGDMLIDSETKRLVIGDKRIELTRKEYEILSLLARHPGRIFSREEILRRIWESDVIVNDRTVDVNITRLRRKMDDYGNHIHNKAGFGYFFEINA